MKTADWRAYLYYGTLLTVMYAVHYWPITLFIIFLLSYGLVGWIRKRVIN